MTRLPKYQRYGGQDRILSIIPLILSSCATPGFLSVPLPPVTKALQGDNLCEK
jgi:hypothetical protein